MGLIFFSLAASVVASFGVFPTEFEGGSTITGISPSADIVWAWVFGLTSIITIITCIVTRSVVPLGIYIFGQIFWTSFIRTQAILSVGGYIPGEFVALFTIGAAFIFMAALVGMLTGSG